MKISGWCLVLLVNAISAAAAAAVPEWQLVQTNSSLSFIFGQAGTDETGRFRVFPSSFHFDPADLEHSVFEVSVNMKSVDTGDKDRDEILLSKDMFDVKRWPEAHFKTLKIESRGGDEYLAEAELTIRDQTRTIPFPFHLTITAEQGKQVFHLQSELSLNRLDFGVGQGEWKETTWIADAVQVLVKVQAAQATIP
ncbi:MAG TPA: YceI family protein [Gammaproteobacteria bacterium]